METKTSSRPRKRARRRTVKKKAKKKAARSTEARTDAPAAEARELTSASKPVVATALPEDSHAFDPDSVSPELESLTITEAVPPQELGTVAEVDVFGQHALVPSSAFLYAFLSPYPTGAVKAEKQASALAGSLLDAKVPVEGHCLGEGEG